MRALSIELADETVDALEAERELFGFESRQAYVRWIIANRGSIEADRESDPDHEARQDRVLADHGERIARLEERIGALTESLEGEREDAGEGTEAPSSGDETTVGAGRATPKSDADRTDAGTATTDATESSDRNDSSDGATRESSAVAEATGDAAAAATDGRDPDRQGEREPRLEVRGAPRTVRQGPDATIRSDNRTESATASQSRVDEPTDGEGGDANADSSQASSRQSTDSAQPTADSLTPERVARIPEDPVHEDAGVLGNVESERLDELSRRAVATTRKRLDRDVQTGLEYTSSTRLAGAGVRPGEDITDLDALSIPGRSAETLEKRRHAVGRALAFLRDEGRARRSDFVDALYAECPAGYETAEGWWECIKEALKQVEAVDGGEGTRVWRYRG